MQDALYYLTVIEGPAIGSSFPVVDGEHTIGRSSKSSMQIETDTEISRQHVKVVLHQGSLTVEDLGSTHGSFLNNNRLRGTVSLAPGDMIKLGATVLRLDLPTISMTETAMDLGTGQEQAPEPASRATDFASVDEGPATQFNDNIQAIVDVEDGPATRMFQQEETRMMEGKELEGLRAGTKKETSRFGPLIGLALLTLLIIAVLAAYKIRSEKNAAPLFANIDLPDYNLALVHPKSWSAGRGQGDQVAVIQLPDVTTGKQIGQISVRATEKADFRYQAMSEAFTEFMKETAGIHSGFNLIRSGDTRINNINAIRYKFTSTEHSGAGLFFLNREQRIVVEALTLRAAWAQQEPGIEGVFAQTRLTGQQILLNFPKATDEMKQLALQNPAKVEEVARALMEQGDDLVKHLSVRPSNLFHGRNAYRECLQWSSALSKRPAFYQEAARKLVNTVNDLDGSLYQQNALILQALKVRDYVAACAECQRMVQMIPDQTHDYHRRAMEAIDRFCPRQ
jgi:hypothetical protein